MNDLITTGAPLTMSSREIAELTGKEHKNVLADIRKMLTELGKAAADFSATAPIPGPNGSTRIVEVFNLPKRETLILVSGYSVELRARIIDRWQALETGAATPAIPKSLPEALRLAAEAIEERDRLALENKAQAEALALAAPKAETFDRIANATGLLTLRETATTLKVPERKFIGWMQRHDWLYRRPGKGTLLGYAQRIKDGYLEHKAVTIYNDRTGEDEIREQVRVTPLGLTALARRATDIQEGSHG